MMADLDACNELADSLQSEINNYELQAKMDKQIFTQQQADVALLESQIRDITELKDLYKSGERKEKLKNRFAKGLAAGLGIVAAAEAVWIGLKSITN
jgi:hypothetical protein